MTTMQVKFYDKDNDTINYGILINDNTIICACCGGVFDVNEDDVVILKKYNYWVDFSNEIGED